MTKEILQLTPDQEDFIRQMSKIDTDDEGNETYTLNMFLKRSKNDAPFLYSVFHDNIKVREIFNWAIELGWAKINGNELVCSTNTKESYKLTITSKLITIVKDEDCYVPTDIVVFRGMVKSKGDLEQVMRFVSII